MRRTTSATDAKIEVDSVALVGREYLARAPGENDVDALLAQLPVEQGSAAIRDAIRDEYRRGEVARILGWPLSLSEAHLYAIVALTRAATPPGGGDASPK